MNVKTFTIILGSQSFTIHVAAVPGTNNLNEKGFIAYSFKANIPIPTNLNEGFELHNYLFPTELEALKEGVRIAKAKLRHGFSQSQKEFKKKKK